MNRSIYAKTGILLSRFYNFPEMWQIWKERQCENAFLLRTMSRSGSHYFMNILANYIAFNFFDASKPIDFNEIQKRFWCNIYHRNLLYKPKALFNKTGFSSYKFCHVQHDLCFPEFQYYRKKPKVIIQIYRNPLDQIVSQHFCDGSKNGGAHLKDSMDVLLADFVESYTSIKALSKQKNVKNISYAHLVKDPLNTLREVLLFSNIPFCKDNLVRAVDASAKEKIGPPHVRRGIVGEWKEHFTEGDVKKIEQMLQKEGLSLSEFIVE